MATPSQAQPQAGPQHQQEKPTSKPTIDILPDPTAQLAANLHPVLLLSLLALSFRSLVRDPMPTLLGLAPTVAVIQLVYCAVCLPASGQAATTAVGASANKPGSKRKKPRRGMRDVGARVTPAILSLLLTTTLAAPLLYLTVLLFGGPLTSHTPHTALLALHVALLAAPPLFHAHGLDAATWLRAASLRLALDRAYGAALGALAGAWAGAAPIPLDWDRDWQRWPVTVVVGAYVGAVLGGLLGGSVGKGLSMRIT